MGIQDRDYYRRRHGGPPSGNAAPTGPSDGSGYGQVRRRPSGTGGNAPRRPPARRSRRIRAKHFFLLVIALVVAGIAWELLRPGALEDLGDEIIGWFTDDTTEDAEPASDRSGSETSGTEQDGDTAEETESASGESGSGASGTEQGGDAAEDAGPASDGSGAGAAGTEQGGDAAEDAGPASDGSGAGASGTEQGGDAAEDAGPASDGSGAGTSGTERDEVRSARAPTVPSAGPPAECPDDAEVLLASSDAPARPGSGIAAGEAAELRQLVLDLTNDARRVAGLSPVRLGANLAPQEHAEDMAESCFLSHWETNGMKPYMRYSLAGGVQANAENVSGSSFCPADPSSYVQTPLTEEARQAFDGLMDSPGHRANILRPEHRLLHLGLAYRSPNFWLVQQFSGHYAAFAQMPTIEDGELNFDMSTCNGARVSREDLGVQIRHDPLPSPLTPGQLQRTSCVSSGPAIAALRPPLQQRQYYANHDFMLPAGGCLDPYLLDPRLPTAQSYEEAKLLKVPARSGQAGSDELGVWITADQWDVGDGRVRVAADLSALLRVAGSGVYTILIWGSVGGDEVPIAGYSIFVE